VEPTKYWGVRFGTTDQSPITDIRVQDFTSSSEYPITNWSEIVGARTFEVRLAEPAPPDGTPATISYRTEAASDWSLSVCTLVTEVPEAAVALQLLACSSLLWVMKYKRRRTKNGVCESGA